MDNNRIVILGEAPEDSDSDEVNLDDRATPISHEMKQEPQRTRDLGQNISLLHRTLYAKNQQFYACLNHFFRHPLRRASEVVNNVSHRLVIVQKGLQEAESILSKIEKEQSYKISL